MTTDKNGSEEPSRWTKSEPKRTVPIGPYAEAAERTRRLVRMLSPKVPMLLKKILTSRKVSDEIKAKAILMILDWVLGLPEDDIEVQAAVFGLDGDELV